MAKQQRRGSGYRRAAEITTKYYLLLTRGEILIIVDVQEKTKSEEGTSIISTRSKTFGKLLGAELAERTSSGRLRISNIGQQSAVVDTPASRGQLRRYLPVTMTVFGRRLSVKLPHCSIHQHY